MKAPRIAQMDFFFQPKNGTQMITVKDKYTDDSVRPLVRVYNSAPETVSIQVRVQFPKQTKVAHANLNPAEARELLINLLRAVRKARQS